MPDKPNEKRAAWLDDVPAATRVAISAIQSLVCKSFEHVAVNNPADAERCVSEALQAAYVMGQRDVEDKPNA